MILDAVLFSLAEIAYVDKKSVVILPEMKLPSTEEIRITHPVSGFELWLNDQVDYTVIEFNDIWNHQDRMFAPYAAGFALRFSTAGLLLVEAKQELRNYIPDAVGQAVTLLNSSDATEVRICLPDGKSWLFFV